MAQYQKCVHYGKEQNVQLSAVEVIILNVGKVFEDVIDKVLTQMGNYNAKLKSY